MAKLGSFVGVNIWTFFNEIYDDLIVHYPTEVYKRRTFNIPLLYGRLNRWGYREGIRSILSRNDVCFFEWASDLLVIASYLPKKSKIVTRLHSFELYDWAPKIKWDSVDKIILVSYAMQRMFAALYPAHASKTEVIYNGRMLNQFHPPKR